MGQEGKNVIRGPTADGLLQLQAMLVILKIQPQGVLYDLSSGDGKIVIIAAQRLAIRAGDEGKAPELPFCNPMASRRSWSTPPCLSGLFSA